MCKTRVKITLAVFAILITEVTGTRQHISHIVLLNISRVGTSKMCREEILTNFPAAPSKVWLDMIYYDIPWSEFNSHS